MLLSFDKKSDDFSLGLQPLNELDINGQNVDDDNLQDFTDNDDDTADDSTTTTPDNTTGGENDTAGNEGEDDAGADEPQTDMGDEAPAEPEPNNDTTTDYTQEEPPEDNEPTENNTDDTTDYTQEEPPEEDNAEEAPEEEPAQGEETAPEETDGDDTGDDADNLEDFTDEDFDDGDDTPAEDSEGEDNGTTENTGEEGTDDQPAEDNGEDTGESGAEEGQDNTGTGAGGGNDDGDSGLEDFTKAEQPDDTAGDSGDDDSGGTDDSGNTDNGDGSENDKPDLLSMEKDLFADMSPEQLAIKNTNLLQNYIDLYDSLNSIFDDVNKIPKTFENTRLLEFIGNKLVELRDYVNQIIKTTYITRTYVENLTEYRKALLILQQINTMLKSIVQKPIKH